MNDHYHPYGTLPNPANCWMMICEESKGCLYTLKITKEKIGLSEYQRGEPADRHPERQQSIGRKDLLSGEEQVKAVITGKTIIRRVRELGWPECEDKDNERSLDGAKEVWNLLLAIKAKGKYLQ